MSSKVTRRCRRLCTGRHTGGISEALRSYQETPFLNLRKMEPAEKLAEFASRVLPPLRRVAPEYVRAFYRPRGGVPLEGRVSYRSSDVFVWAVAVGEQSLARVLWRRVKNPIRQALLAAAMCRRMGAENELQQQPLEADADRYEAWACGLLDHLPREQARAHVTWLSPLPRPRVTWSSPPPRYLVITPTCRASRRAPSSPTTILSGGPRCSSMHSPASTNASWPITTAGSLCMRNYSSPLCTAQARPPRLLRARLLAPCSSALPG